MKTIRIPEEWTPAAVARRVFEPLVAWGRRDRDEPPRNPNLPPGWVQVGVGENGRPIIGKLGPEIPVRGLNVPEDS